MAKMRGYKPELWSWPKFVRVSPLARLLYLGMWNHACDNGHTGDDAFELKLQVLPNDPCDPDALVAELVDAGLVERHDGFLKIPKLAKHQHVDLRYLVTCEHCERDEHAKYAPSDRARRTKGARSAPHGHPKGARSAPHGHPTGARSAPHGRPANARVEGEGEGEGEYTPPRAARAECAPDPTLDPFGEFWSSYPKKVGKGQAERAWRAATKTTDPDVILEGLQRAQPSWTAIERRFIPNPSTWLNGKRWLDEVHQAHDDDHDDWSTRPSTPYRFHDEGESQP